MKVKKSSTSAIFFGLIFAAVGIFIIVIGIKEYFSMKEFEKTAETISATIVDIDSHKEKRGTKKHRRTVTVYDLTVQYEVDGQTYTKVIDNGQNKPSIGSTVDVMYDPANPSDTRRGSSTGALAGTGIIGGIFTLAGGFLAGVDIRKMLLKNRLIKNGIKMSGTIINADCDASVRINGRHPYKAECEVTDSSTGNVYRYSSESVRNDLSAYVGLSVDVYVDPNDRSKSYVDLESVDTSSVGFYDYT